MKCFYIGDFRKPYSSENYVAYGLRENGVEVVEFQETRGVSTRAVYEYTEQEKPDFVLFCKNRIYGRGDILMKALNEKGFLTVTWLFDLYFGLPNEMGSHRTVKDSPFMARMVFTSDGGHDAEWKKERINHYLLRQGIHAPEAKRGKKLGGIPPILFIGSNTYWNRDKLITRLRDRYKTDFRHYGQGGEAPEIRGEYLNNILASTKIVVGDSVPSDNYWSNRIYEILGRGGFLLHPYVKGIESEFVPYKHFVPYEYGNYEQLYEIVDYYLTHDKEREKIRRAGHKLVATKYTYTKRCQTLLQEIIGTREQ
jgi:hypothetical protein